jgi:hypothetical protein
MDEIRSAFARQGLYRATDDRVLAGCSPASGAASGSPLAVALALPHPADDHPGQPAAHLPVLWILMPEQQHVTGPWTPGQPPQR